MIECQCFIIIIIIIIIIISYVTCASVLTVFTLKHLHYVQNGTFTTYNTALTNEILRATFKTVFTLLKYGDSTITIIIIDR